LLPDSDHSAFARHIGLIWTRASLRLRLVQAFLELAATTPTVTKPNTRKQKKLRS
jgi:hypothetical protein